MHHAELSPFTVRLLLIGLLSIAFSTLVVRALIFFRSERTGAQAIYPLTWNAAQCRALEHFRLVVGLALMLLWGAFLFVAPSLRTDWAYGHLELCFFVFLLWVSDAWVLLLLPRNWQRFGAISRSFWIVIVFLIAWWGAIFTATGWMFVKASTTPLDLHGPYAAQKMPLFI